MPSSILMYESIHNNPLDISYANRPSRGDRVSEASKIENSIIQKLADHILDGIKDGLTDRQAKNRAKRIMKLEHSRKNARRMKRAMDKVNRERDSD